jgi:hypothetical protein
LSERKEKPKKGETKTLRSRSTSLEEGGVVDLKPMDNVDYGYMDNGVMTLVVESGCWTLDREHS